MCDGVKHLSNIRYQLEQTRVSAQLLHNQRINLSLKNTYP